MTVINKRIGIKVLTSQKNIDKLKQELNIITPFRIGAGFLLANTETETLIISLIGTAETIFTTGHYIFTIENDLPKSELYEYDGRTSICQNLSDYFDFENKKEMRHLKLDKELCRI